MHMVTIIGAVPNLLKPQWSPKPLLPPRAYKKP